MARVTVGEGLLEGEVIKNPFGGSYYSFKGIPYAEPPLGDLRFKAPQPKTPWTGVRSAKEHGPICFQYDFDIEKRCLGDEDCLYLNVYSPELKPSEPLPVMFWIHGGGFAFGHGNADMYGPDFLVRHGIILITINYRTEALGFLSLDTEDIPGNAGMKDQVAALRWVNKNIRQFGGDPQNITIFGESAGSVSVSYHLISPMTKGLFRRAIAQSGSALSSWAQAFEARERARAHARQLGLETNDDKELYEFYKSVPREQLVRINAPITLAEVAIRQGLNLQFSIVSESKFGDNERFFYGDANEAFRNGIHEGVEVMAGYCEHEGYVGVAVDVKLEELIQQANNFLQIFTPNDIALNCSQSDQLEVGRRFKEYYCKDKKISMKEIDPLVNYISVESFVHKIIQMVKFCVKKNKTYLYKFTCKSERNIFGSIILGLQSVIGDKKVVSHADDLPYLFNHQFLPVDTNSEVFKYIEKVVKLWTNFAKHGDPTPDDSLGARWVPYTPLEQNYLDIGRQLVAGTAPDSQEIAFWDAIYRRYLPSHLAE